MTPRNPGRASNGSPSGRGFFIVFEGIDGAGKTTQARNLRDRLENAGLPTLLVKEPTEGPWGQKAREIAKHGRGGITPEEELEIYIRDRADDVLLNINPALKSGTTVIADRYILSNVAYQSALGLDPRMILQRNESFPRPDLTFIIDVVPEEGLRRAFRRSGEGLDTGYEKTDFLIKVRDALKKWADSSAVFLDGRLPKEQLADEIWKIVMDILPHKVTPLSNS